MNDKASPEAFPGQYDIFAQSKGLTFWQTFLEWQRQSNAILSPFDLTQPQFSVLAAIGWSAAQGHIVRQQDVSNFLKMDRMLVSQIVRKLETKAFLSRMKSKVDKRSSTLFLSETGKRTLQKCVPIIEDFDEKFFDPHRQVQPQLNVNTS